MSQNKTVIQGLEPENNGGRGGRSPMGGASPDFYSRGNRSSVAHGTVVPGMMDEPAPMAHGYGTPQPEGQPRRQPAHTGRPVVGFLYSISRTGMGEYWPLQMGRNTVGKDPSSDIQLAEGTVSGNHAVIVTRLVKGHVIAAITDSQSTNGTMINGETIGFTAEQCQNGDIVTFGNNYQCVIILIDCAELGLSVSKDFITVEPAVDEDDSDYPDVPHFDPHPTRPGGFDPSAGGYNPAPGGFDPYSSNSPGGTVGLDGSQPGGNHGGTIPM